MSASDSRKNFTHRESAALCPADPSAPSWGSPCPAAAHSHTPASCPSPQVDVPRGWRDRLNNCPREKDLTPSSPSLRCGAPRPSLLVLTDLRLLYQVWHVPHSFLHSPLDKHGLFPVSFSFVNSAAMHILRSCVGPCAQTLCPPLPVWTTPPPHTHTVWSYLSPRPREAGREPQGG